MDLAKILADLKAAQDDFRQSDKAFATATFCQRTCKVLDEVVKGTENEEFENLVIGIWIVISSVNDLLPQLIEGPLLTELAEKLFRQCARVVLDIKWQQLDPSESSRENLENALSVCHQYMAPRGFTRFGVVNGLMAEPWTDPTLTMVMGSEEDNEEGKGLAYIRAQDPEILKLRVDLMYQENCDEFALNLCFWCLKHPVLAGDFTLHKIQFILLHRLGLIDRLQEECQSMGVVDSIRLINSLHGKEEHKELCTMLAQTFLVQNWIKPSEDNSKVELLRLWIRLQYQADEDQDNFVSNLWAVAKVSRSTEQLLLIIDAVREKCGDTLLQFYLDLCIFAINVDKGCWEKLKESAKTGPNEELMARKKDMAQVCNKLAHIVSHVSAKVAFCCALTSFAMVPSEQSLQAVRDSYQRKCHAEMSGKAQCCSNCASEAGECLKNEDRDKKNQDVNVATLYEVERLCSMLRPSYLSCDSDLPSLLSLCKQYLRKEKGEPIRSALLQQKSLASVQGTSSAMSAAGTSQDVSSVPAQQRAAPVRRTVDASASVSNVDIPSATASVYSSGRSPRGRVTPVIQSDAASTHFIQRLVLNQLPSDTVQTLLNLIQTKQVSPVHLNHIMTQNPDRCVQILERFVSQFRQGGGVNPDTNEQRQQQDMQQQPQTPPEQLSQIRLQSVQQQVGISTVPQSAGMVAGGLQKKDRLTSTIHALQQTLTHRPLMGQTQMTGSIVRNQESIAQQLQVKPYPQQQARVSAQAQYSQIPKRGQHVRPIVPSLSALHLSDSSEVKGTSPVQVMSVKRPSPMQTSSSGAQILSTSKTSVNVSGSSVLSVQKAPQIVRLPSTPGSISGLRPNSKPKILPKILHRTPEQIMGSEGTAAACCQPSSASSENAGNRCYSINNLLFTGEQQNNTLSIALPDTLPEISVDSISDTLQALSGPPGGGSQVMLTGPVSHLDMSASFSSNSRVTSNMSSTVSMSAQVSMGAAQIQTSVPPETASFQHDSGNFTCVPFSTPTTQASTPCTQPLPSFSSLFVSNPSAVHVSVPVSSALVSTTAFVSQSTGQKTSPGIACAQKLFSEEKAEDMGVRKSKEWHVTDKEKMMQLLKQAMTIKVEKKENRSVMSAANTLTPNQLSVPSGSVPLGGCKYTRGPAPNLSSSLTRPLLRQSPQLVQTAVCRPKSQQPAPPVLQTPATSAPSVLGSSSVPTAQYLVTCMSSGMLLSTSSFVSSHHTSVAVQASSYIPPSLSSANQKIISSKPANVISSKPPNVISSKPPNVISSKPPNRNTQIPAVQNYPMTSVPKTSFPKTSSYVAFPTHLSGCNTVDYTTEMFMPVQTSSVTSVKLMSSSSSTPQSVGSVKTYPKTESGGTHCAGETQMRPVTSETILTSILPEGGGVIERATSGNQSVATYRCIICATAFMTLNALRYHVKQICKPGLTVGNSVAVSKAKANEAGVETSTVFQCMRCFELCISEAGIREHKQVCVKGAKQKAKPKSKAKPRVVSPETEEATEAKVQELLNKCLGENRERLLQEAEAQAAKLANAKKKSSKKRPSVDEEHTLVGQTVVADGGYLAKKPRQEETSPLTNLTTVTVHEHPGVRTACINIQASVGNFRNVVESTTNTSFIETVTEPTSSLCTTTACSSLPITTVLTAAGASLETTSTSVAQAAAVIPSTLETEVMPTTTTDTTAVCKEAQLADSKPHSEITSEAEQFSADASLQTVSAMKTDEAAEQPSSPAEPLNNETAENAGRSPVQQDVKEAIPPPQYKELKGSCGRSFFKCLNCGQTLCSMQSLNEHWQECIIKNPLSEREDHVPKENKTTVDGDNSRTMDDDVKTGFNDARSCQCSKQSVNVKAVVAEESVKVSSVPSVMRSADCNKDRVPSKLDGKNGSSAPLVKQSVVVLEKISLPEKSTAEVFRIVESVDNETKNVETDHQSAEGNDSESLSDSSSTASLKRSTSKDNGLLGKTCKIHLNSPTRKDVTVEVISKDSSQGFGPVMENKPLKGDNRYCSVCKHSYSQPTDFVQHLAGVHLKLYSQRSVGKNIIYICHLCQQKFAGYNRYISHVVIHSQAIIQKFDEKNCGKVKPSEHRSVTDDTEESAGHQKKRQSQASPGDGPEEGNTNELDQRKCPTTLSSTTPSSANDRRSSGRAAQKQALNKIFISSLGINSFVEPLKESNKRKTSYEESSIAVNRPKRSRLSESMVEVIDSEDEENSEESSGETDEDDAFAKKSGDTRGSLAATFRSKAGEKASMGNNKVQTAKHGVEQSSTCAHSPQGGALPSSAPKTQSHFTMAPQKPSFMDSFLHFVNTRSPDAPLPLYKSKRRYSYLHDNLESSTPATSQWRRNSCEEHMIHGTSPHQRAVLKLSPVMKSAHKSDSVSDTTLLPKYKSSEACVSKQSSSDFENVYFYGEFEKQLTQQVKVNLGCRVKPEEVQLKQTIKRQNSSEMPVINVKECSVNLGRKVNAEDLMNSVICLENVMLQEPILFDMSCDEEDNDSDTESDSDTVVASCSALSPVRDTEDTISLDGIPLVSNPGPPCSGLLPAADKMCVEATQPVFPPPKVVSLEKDSAATISSVSLQVAKETSVSPAQICENPSEETVRVTVSSVAFGSRETKPISVTASQNEMADNAERTADSVGGNMDNVKVYSATVGDITTQHVTTDDITTHSTTVGDIIPGSAAVDDNTTDSATIDDLTDSATVDDITVDCITVDDITTDSETVDDILCCATVDDIMADCAAVSDVTTDIATVDGITANSMAVDDITPDRATPGDITPPDNVTVDDVTADNATVDDITADQATVDDITTNTAPMDDITQVSATVDEITQVSATVDDIRADSVTVGDMVDNATVDDITSDNAASRAITGSATVDNFIASSTTEDYFTTDNATVDDITRDNTTVDDITTDNATVDDIIPNNTTVNDITIDNATVNDITTDNATVHDAVTPNNATVNDITTDNATVDNITPDSATVDDTATDNAAVDGSSRDATIADGITTGIAVVDDITDDITTGSAVVDDVTPDNMMAGVTTTENTGADDITRESPVADDITRDSTVADDITRDNTEADDITAESIVADDIAMDKTVGDDIVTDKTVADDTTTGNTGADDITTDSIVTDDITTDSLVTDDITTDRTVADDITTDRTVADDITTDTTVADDITIDTTVADGITADSGEADDITTESAVEDDITADRTVADDIAADRTVADDIAADRTVADDITADRTVADDITADRTVVDDITADRTVADDITADRTVADDITADRTVADGIAADRTVADDIAADRTVADDITADRTVADDITADRTVADDITADRTEADDITADRTVADDITADRTVADGVTADRTVADDITADRTVANDVTADRTEADDITADRTVADDITADRTVANDVTADRTEADDITADNMVAGDITTDQTMANSTTADNMTEDDVTTGKASIAANRTAEENDKRKCRIAVDDITTDSTAAVHMTTDNLTVDDSETDSPTKDYSTVDKCTLDGITTENIVTDDIATDSATTVDVITENPADDDLSVTVDDITQDNSVTGDITTRNAVTDDITTDNSSVDDFSADSSADNFTTDNGTVDDLATDNVTAINTTTDEGACESAADRVTLDISLERVAVSHISVESVTACDRDTSQERDGEQLLENDVMVKHQVDTNTETVTLQELHMEKSPTSPKYQDSRWTVLDEEESCNRSSLLVTKEFGFDQSVKEEGRKKQSVDSELMAALKNVSDASQDDEKEKRLEPRIPEMSDSEINDQYTKISAAEAEECNEKSDNLLEEVRETLPSTDSENRTADIDTCLPEGLSDLDTDQSVQTTEIREKTVSSKKEVSELESGDGSHNLGNADNIECEDPSCPQPARGDKKPELEVAVFPEVNQENVSLEHDVETNASSLSTENSLSVFPQEETHQNEESQEWTEKHSIPEAEMSKETEGFWADGVVTSIEKEDEQNQEQNDTVSEQDTVEGSTHRNINVVQLSCEGAASQHDLDQSSKSAIELQEKQVFSAVDTLQKQQTISTKETSVTSVEDDNNADEDMEVDDDIDCDGWDTGEDEVNCIDLPGETQIEETSISSCREIQSACERETSLSSFIDKHRVCDALDPTSKGNEVTETNSHSCNLITASTTPPERLPADESPLPLGTDRTRQGESESVEALDKCGDCSLDADLRCDLHSVSSVDTEGQWKKTDKSANNSCESVELTHDTFPPGGVCSSSWESSVQAQSNTFGTVSPSTCQTPITAAEVSTLPSSTRQQSLCCQQQVETEGAANSATGVEGTSQEPLPDGPATSLFSQQSVCNSDDSVNCSTYQLKTNDLECEALEPCDLSADGADQFDQSPTVQQDQEGADGVEKRQKTQGDLPWLSDPHRLESNGSASLLMGDGDSPVDSATVEVPKSVLDSSLSVMPGPGYALVSDEITSGSSIMEVQDCKSTYTETTCEQSQDIAVSTSFDRLENERVFEVKRTLGVESAQVEVKAVLSDSTQVEAKASETNSAFSANTPLSDNNTTSTFFTQSEDQKTLVKDSTSAVEDSSCSSMRSVVPERVTDDVDSESDLPELCIVPDPHGTIIKPCMSERSVKKKADTCESTCNREQNESSASMNESHERQYRSQRVSQKKKGQTTYIEIKEKEVVAKEESEAQLESPTSSRKPLLGVKSLRHMHNPQPFVWDVEGEEDCKKRQRNERSLKAFRSKIHVAPFSWDQECSDQHKKTSEQTPTAASWDSEVEGIRISQMDPENRERDSQKTASGSFGTLATRDEKYSNLAGGEGLFGGRFGPSRIQNMTEGADTEKCIKVGPSRIQNMTEGADTEKCIKVKTLTTSAQGRLLPRPKGTLRSGSCEKTIVTLSRPCSSGDRRSMLSVEERPLRKSRSCDLEYSCVQSEHPLEPESSQTEKQQTKVTPMKMNIKIEDRGDSCITKGLKSTTKSYQHSERQATTPRKKSLRQHVPVSEYAKTEQGEGCSSTDARVDKIGSKQSVERNVKEEKSEEQRNEISTNLKNEYEGHQQQSGNTVSSTKLVGSKDVGLNKVDSHFGSNTSSKLTTVFRQGSPLSDRVGSSRSHSSPTRQCRSRDRTVREKDAGDDTLPESAQPDLSDCVRYLRNRLSKKPKDTGVEDTSLPREGNETAQKKSTVSVTRKPAQAFAESAVKTWSPSSESSHYQSHSNKLVTPKSCAMLPAKRNSETDVLYPDSLIQRSQKSISHTQSPPESSQQYLTAMVRRRHRPVSWQTVTHQLPKKSRITPPETPQYEIIRVEPVTSETSSSQQRLQSSEVMRAPRTLHTRVDDFSPVQRPEAAKRWQINRHITPAEKRKKKIADPNFPFSFNKRARGRTRTK